MRHWLAALAIWTGTTGLAGASAACVGTNLFDAMPEDRLARIEAAVEGVPYHRGLLWRATRGDQVITLVGTYHFGDPRHQGMLDRIQPALSRAAVLYVEAGPEEEARLTRALTEDPSLMVNTSGPTLAERLSDAEWAALSAAMADRGTPAVVASKLRPWYVAMMLGISPCMMRNMTEDGDPGGLDHLLVNRAEDLEVPVRALEPWNTVFTLFEGMTPGQEIDMIRASLPAASHADDYAVTLTEAYFAGDVWKIWEFGRFDAYDNSGLPHATVDDQMRLAQAQLMDRRNLSWIDPLTGAAENAAAQGKGIVAGFGALHLPGEQGVLRLLERRGWTIERLND